MNVADGRENVEWEFCPCRRRGEIGKNLASTSVWPVIRPEEKLTTYIF